MVKLSVTTKLDGIPSWSLEAVETCPGSRMDNGELVDACKGCYARSGNYVFSNVKRAREHNRKDWQEDTWTQRMITILGPHRYFRWFDSGDVYHPQLAKKIKAVIEGTPWCKHWLPTRSHKIPRIAKILDEIDALPNAVVRRSSDSIDGEFTPGVHGSTIIHSMSNPPPGVTVCYAYKNQAHNCNGCRHCWDKSIPVIAYPAHGRSINKLIAIRSSTQGIDKVAI